MEEQNTKSNFADLQVGELIELMDKVTIHELAKQYPDKTIGDFVKMVMIVCVKEVKKHPELYGLTQIT